MIRAAFASENADKLAELRDVLVGWQVEPLAGYVAPEETGSTYYENALLKARHGRRVAAPTLVVLGEDSGIECDALAGAPGVHSARWAAGRDQADALLERLAGVEERGARMVSELVCITPTLVEVHTVGVLEGEIARARRGDGGFGYDPIFVPRGAHETVAEMGDDWKRRYSHRATAALALVAALGGASSLRLS